MNDFLCGQIKDFLHAFLLGMLIGIAYDIIRIIRRVIKHNIVAISVEDVIFLLTIAPLVCFFFVKSHEGCSRLYLISSMILGVFIWQRLIGRHVVAFLAKFFEKTLKNHIKVLKKVRKSIKIKGRFLKKGNNVARGGNVEDKKTKRS